MFRSFRAASAALFLAVAASFALTSSPAMADTVVVGNQIFQGNVCAGTPCLNGNAFGGQQYQARGGNTPGIGFIQDASLGYTPQQWDVAGNEANFFVRDTTGGSQLAFRIFPGATTNSLRVESNSMTSSVGTFDQYVNAQTVLGVPDGASILTYLRTLPLQTYSVNDDGTASPHVRPDPVAFRAAFGLGPSDSYLADSDVAGVALTAVKELDARVSALSLTPGPQGSPGSQGSTGPAADLTTANKKIAKLESVNKKLAASLKKLQKQVAKLMRK